MDVVALTLVGKVTGGVALLRSVDDAERDDQGQGHLQAGDVRDLEQNRADTSPGGDVTFGDRVPSNSGLSFEGLYLHI